MVDGCHHPNTFFLFFTSPPQLFLPSHPHLRHASLRPPVLLAGLWSGDTAVVVVEVCSRPFSGPAHAGCWFSSRLQTCAGLFSRVVQIYEFFHQHVSAFLSFFNPCVCLALLYISSCVTSLRPHHNRGRTERSHDKLFHVENWAAASLFYWFRHHLYVQLH